MNYQKHKEENKDMAVLADEPTPGLEEFKDKLQKVTDWYTKYKDVIKMTEKERLEMDERGQLSQEDIEERLQGSRLVHPDHYKGYAFDVIDIANEYKLDFLEGNVLKYLLRWRRKNGLEDLKKAQTYLNLLIEKQDGKIMLCRKL